MSERKQTGPERWQQTARNLVGRSTANVHCPDCGRHTLSVQDREYGYGADKGVQRYLMCGSCGAFQVVALKRAGTAVA